MTRKAAAPKTPVDPATVRLFEAAPSPMFPDQITALMRFAKPVTARRCPVCGKTTRKLWTMLCPFRAAVHPMKMVVELGPERAPLTLVCSDHPVSPTRQIMEAVEGISIMAIDAAV